MSQPSSYEYDVFVSYASADEEWVHNWLLPRLKEARVGRRKMRVCVDTECFQAGVPLLDEMRRAVTSSAKTVVVLTPDYLESGWTSFQYTLQRSMDIQQRQYRLIPLLLKPCDLPPDVSSLVCLDFTGDEAANLQFQRLVKAIGGASGPSKPRVALKDKLPRLPFPGYWLLLMLVAVIVLLILVVPGILHGREPTPTATATATSSPTATPAPPSRPIVFASKRDGNAEIYSVRADGTGLMRLTKREKTDAQALWAPDGSRIAFISEREGTPELYVMDRDGQGVKRLTFTPGGDKWYAWSPDSRKLVVERKLASGEGRDFYVVEVDGSGQRALPQTADIQWNANWSSDSTRILFVGRGTDDPELYTTDAQGQNPTQLTDNSYWEQLPTWSPDGRLIAFVTERSGWRMYAMQSDGSKEYQLGAGINPSVYAVWSPLGDRIALVGQSDGQDDVFVMNADGSGQIQLTQGSHNDRFPTWSPDGSQIAFESDRSGLSQIYVISSTGGGEAICVSDGEGYAPSWAR